jgi:NADH:ubiquinone oxidoreductase subunit B-like Fe-S oxidoreductase
VHPGDAPSDADLAGCAPRRDATVHDLRQIEAAIAQRGRQQSADFDIVAVVTIGCVDNIQQALIDHRLPL